MKNDEHSIVPYTGERLSQARAFASLHDDELKRRATEAARDKNFAALWELTLAYLTSDTGTGVLTSRHTLRSYRRSVQVFLEHSQENAWNLLRPARRAASLYVGHLNASGLSAATVNVRIAGASALYRALRWAGATDADPFNDVKRPRNRTRSIVKNPPYRADFIQDIALECDSQTKTLLFLLSHSGLRISEALNVEWEHFDLGNRRLLVQFGKGGKSRYVPLSRRCRESLIIWRAECGLPVKGRIFTFRAYSTAYGRLKQAAKRAGRETEFRGFHASRKYAGTSLYASVKDFTRVATFLGHEQVDTTRRYVEIPEDDVQDIIEGFV